MLTFLRMAIVFTQAFILVYLGYDITTWPFWLVALCTISYGALIARETVLDIEKLLRKGDFNNHS